MNKFDFKNRTAVITGGGQGFGLRHCKKIFRIRRKSNYMGYRWRTYSNQQLMRSIIQT